MTLIGCSSGTASFPKPCGLRDARSHRIVITVSTEHIEITPGICGGKPRIAGHRITVQNVVIWHERMGMSPEEIAAAYPSITLADVYAALAYYLDHRDEIIARI